MPKSQLPEGPTGPPVDLWLLELNRLFPPTYTGDGVTISDLVDRLGWSRSRASVAIKHLVRRGLWMFVGHVSRQRIDGHYQPTPAYAPRPTPGKEDTNGTI